MDLKRIKSLAERDQYDEALAECENLISTAPENRADILRTRAYVFALQGDYLNAMQDRQAILEMGEGSIRDYYRAADNALSAGQLEQAASWFKEVIRLGDEQNEEWFESASYFLLAYTEMELGQYQAAMESLERAVAVEANVEMPLPGSCGVSTPQQLREEINRRQKTKRSH